MASMSGSAWVFLLTAWTLICVFATYCFTKLLTSKQQLDRDEEIGVDG